MKATEINQLIQIGATDRVRKKLKRMGMEDRLKSLFGCIPYIDNPKSIDFFKKNFSVELGAIIEAKGNLSSAETLYRQSKKKRR
jgi:hypothetical protein